MQLPSIGITLDFENPGAYSSFPWYALRENYSNTISRAGGLPIGLPHEINNVNEYLNLIDGLLITGGNFDVDPSLFGAKERHESINLKENRTSFELALTKGALERKMPILGICGGQQLLHVALGGKLIQHIPDSIENAIAHQQPNPRNEASHKVIIKKGSLLYDIVENECLDVNSAHHQAALDEPKGVTINAHATDGVVEGIEANTHDFCLGVQWHPEFEINEGDAKIFRAFVEASRKFK